MAREGIKRMPPLDLNRFREDYWKSIQWEKPFYLERPAVFSPAAAAQENYGDCYMMFKFISAWLPWQYTGFLEEASSFHDTAYLGDWSALTKLRVTGPDALAFLSRHSTNNMGQFATGQIKHAIQTNAEGKVAGEGILYKISEEEYRYTGGAVYWLDYWIRQDSWKAEGTIDTPDEFVFVIQGPNSLYIMERATGERLRDIRFMQTRLSSIAGHEVRILRTGVTGELGYEVHGRSELGQEVWVALHEAGKEFGVRLLGGRSMLVSHVEGCFPTITRDYWPAAAVTGGKSRAHTVETSGGSYEWSDPRELMRSPFELGWEREVSLDSHEFMGREALLAERNAGGPARRIVGLKWNSDDVIDVFAALFRPGPVPTPMELPRVTHKFAMDPDKVLKDGRVVGCSTSRAYSPFFRQMISLCVIDKGLTEPGTEVTVVWGDRGGPQKEIRATVTEVPFKEDQRRTDVTRLPFR
jgi:glycine cleavage system aminomethyltransferase T